MSTHTKTSVLERSLSKLRAGCSRWNEFWFKPEDPFTLGMIRVLTGWMLSYNLLVWGLDLQAFFSSEGLQPLASIIEFHDGQHVFSFLFYVPDGWLVPVHWTCFAIALLFCVGLGTRITSILAYVITVSYSQRVPVANFGLDQILGLLCLYLAIGPSGAAFSLDSLLRQRRDISRRAASASRHDQPREFKTCRMALRLIQIHICVIYFWAGFAKLKGDSWWTGEAMWQVIANQEYQTIDLTWMAWVPWLPYLIAHVTVAWEVFFCVLIWNKTLRPWMLLIGTAMHFGIGAFLGMWTFGLIMTFAYFSFADPEIWRTRVNRIWKRKQVTLKQPDFREQSTGEDSTANNRSPMQAALVGEPGNQTGNSTSCGNTSARQTVPPTIYYTQKTNSLSEASTPEALPRLTNDSYASATGLIVVSAHPQERDTLRQYFRRHDIPCQAAANASTAITIATSLQPAAIVVSGSRIAPAEIRVLLDDLADAVNAPILAILSPSQTELLSKQHLSARITQFPLSPRAIRQELSDLLFGAADSQDHDLCEGKILSQT